jgi:hypothetical protein
VACSYPLLLESADFSSTGQLAPPVGRLLVHHLGQVEAATGPASRRRVLAVLPQIETLYEVYFVIDRYQAFVAVLAVVASQFFEGERIVLSSEASRYVTSGENTYRAFIRLPPRRFRRLIPERGLQDMLRSELR